MVEGPQKLSFPQDFGPKPDYLTEWWYYTGNLQTNDGRHFGYQLTLFRRAIEPPGDQAPRTSDWAANQVYMAHFTLTDVSAKKFHFFERFERGAAGLAGATLTPAFQVWLHDWSVEQIGPDTYRLKAQEDGVAVDLQMTDTKGPVLQGDQGYSQKGPQPGNASLYFSQTHLESKGKVTIEGQAYLVSGLSWMDREISTSALSKGEVGWDWFALQLNDGSELMAYVLRRSDGTIGQFSSGTLIGPNGETRHLTREDFRITTESTWKSPHSGGLYPARWKLSVPSAELELDIQPQLADQELNVSFIYWEGAVSFSGTHHGNAVTGYGYVELTGYAKSMEGTL
jgi:predicted secreted hydrolase